LLLDCEDSCRIGWCVPFVRDVALVMLQQELSSRNEEARSSLLNGD
jgi:hypothetical protein